MVKKVTAIMAAILLLAAGTASAEVVSLRSVSVSPSAYITFNDGSYSTGYYNFDISTPGAYYGYHSGFCVDPAGLINEYKPYDVRPVSGFGDNYKRAAWLLGQSNASNAILTQIAVWELLFETAATYDVSGGNYFVVSEGWGAAQLLVNAALALNTNTFDTTGYFVAVSPVEGTSFAEEYQDFIFRTPEPGTILLMGLGLIGLAGLRRKE